MQSTIVRSLAPVMLGAAWFAGFFAAPLEARPQAPASVARDSLARALEALRGTSGGATLPGSEAFHFGDETIAAGTRIAGPVAVASGTLHVRGIVDGDAVTYRGDVVVHQGGEVRGNAIALLGKVTLDGGVVSGDVRALRGELAEAVAQAGTGARGGRGGLLASLALAFGWLAVLATIGIGVLVFASNNLDGVADALQKDFGRALLAGIAGQLALLPVLGVLLAGLCLSVIGILLIPFAIVAYVLAAAGLFTLGYLAIARTTGRALVGSSGTDERARRAASLQALLLGLVLLMLPWFVPPLLAWSPTASLAMHTVAIAVTWVAGTTGLGAALVSRGGVRRATAPAAQRAMATASWQTPTPVSGVAAARRPTPMATPVQK